MSIKNVSGFDNISAKVIKQCKPIVSNQLTSLISLSIDTGVFPDSLKKAQVTPLHKKNDPLSKTNYRPPVSIDKLINDVNWMDIIGLHCLITLAGMLSNPEAFFIFILTIIFSILSDVIC
jgi:hypothetical protein